jgi:protein-disulfide isomerase
MKKFSSVNFFLLFAALLPLGCFSADNESRIRAVEAKQDSILTILKVMAEQSEFVALRVGWRPKADNSPKDIPVGTSFTKGPANAVLTLVEFSDFQCPYCARLVPVLDSVARAFPRDVRLVFKHFPLSFHAQARAAAAAGIAAGNQGKFFEFRAKVMPQYRSLDEQVYLTAAQELGLDMKRFRKEMALTDDVNKILDADIEYGRSIGVEGTPSIFVNGQPAQDRSFEYFASLVAEARKSR